jgi:hypothetical protein
MATGDGGLHRAAGGLRTAALLGAWALRGQDATGWGGGALLATATAAAIRRCGCKQQQEGGRGRGG